MLKKELDCYKGILRGILAGLFVSIAPTSWHNRPPHFRDLTQQSLPLVLSSLMWARQSSSTSGYASGYMGFPRCQQQGQENTEKTQQLLRVPSVLTFHGPAGVLWLQSKRLGNEVLWGILRRLWKPRWRRLVSALIELMFLTKETMRLNCVLGRLWCPVGPSIFSKSRSIAPVAWIILKSQ